MSMHLNTIGGNGIKCIYKINCYSLTHPMKLLAIQFQSPSDSDVPHQVTAIIYLPTTYLNFAMNYHN